MPSPMTKGTGGRWEFPYTVSGVLNNANIVTLQTQNKFVDADIDIKLTVPQAAGASLALTDKSNDLLNMGSASSGYYLPTISLSGGVSYTSAGWVTTAGSSGLTDDSVVVGKVVQSTLTLNDNPISSAAEITPTGSAQRIDISAGYYDSARYLTIKPATSGVNAGTITNPFSGTPSSYGTITVGNYIKIGSGYYSSDIYYLAQPVSGTYTVSAAGTNISTGGKTTIDVASSSMVLGDTTVTESGGNYTATRGTITWNSGWATGGSISAATFANQPTDQTTYIDISNTSEAPILTNGILYINTGYVDNISITLGKLIPDTITGKYFAPAEYIRSGYAAYGADGTVIAGSMPDATVDTSLTDNYLSTYLTTTGASSSSYDVSLSPKYSNTNAGYLAAHSTATGSTTYYYKIVSASFTSNGGNVALNTDTSQTNSIYRTGSETYISVESSAPAANTDYVYVKVTGSGTVKASTTGCIKQNTVANATGSTIKYIKIAKYTGSYSTT